MELPNTESSKTLTDTLETLVELRPDEVLFFTGAGISFAAPTCAPGGHKLVERVLGSFFEADVLSKLRLYYKALDIRRTHPRLEMVLDVLQRTQGVGSLEAALSDLRDAPSNALHRFFAAHTAKRGRHITANFDSCIETCGGTGVLHFHGSFADGVGSLGATLARIQHGFPRELTQLLDERIATEETRLVVVIGYSGSDAFDVVPYLRRLPAASMQGKSILWIRHPSEASSARVAQHLEFLAHAGASCLEIVSEPDTILGRFADHWNVSAPVADTPCTSAWVAPVVDAETRRRSSLELWASMGVHREVRALFDARAPATKTELATDAQTLWSEGRYRRAAQRWRMAYEGADAESRALAAERAGSTLWVQGRLLHAFFVLREALRQARSDGIEGERYWLLAEALGHVLVHMQRRPLLRFFVTEARRKQVLAALPTGPVGNYASLGIHLDARLGSLISQLGGEPWPRTAPIVSFDEAEALKAVLSYRHAALRERADRGDLPSAGEYRVQRDQCVAIGAYGDAARVYLIPGAARAFSATELRQDLRGVQLAGWPRLLLVGRFIVDRARWRLGRTRSK